MDYFLITPLQIWLQSLTTSRDKNKSLWKCLVILVLLDEEIWSFATKEQREKATILIYQRMCRSRSHFYFNHSAKIISSLSQLRCKKHYRGSDGILIEQRQGTLYNTLVPIWTKWELVKMIWALRMARLCKINWSCWRFLEAKASKYTYPSIYPWQATEKRTISLPEKKENIFILSIPLSAREEIGYIKADFFFVWTME